VPGIQFLCFEQVHKTLADGDFVKVLVTRTDKLGDLVLSLPVFADLKAAHPQWEVLALVGPDSLPLVENNPHLDGVFAWSDHMTRNQVNTLEQQLRNENFDACIMLQYRRELATLLWRVGIKKRFGPRSKFSSWFLLNRGRRQARSRSNGHEMDYNIQLGRDLLGGEPNPGDAPMPDLHPTEALLAKGRKFREHYAPSAQTVVFVHPGSGGSALDWEPDRFAGVANVMAGKPGCRVFVTGAGADRPIISALEPKLDDGVTVLLDQFNLRDFIGVLSAGDIFIGPSTGPLHMAAALGLATVGLYPPVSTMSPARWAPVGCWTETLVPAVDCPAHRLCKESECSLYNCMTGIFETDVIRVALDLATQRISAGGGIRPSQEDEN
jgi:ADP-heptose:LPS heptosyltransferase